VSKLLRDAERAATVLSAQVRALRKASCVEHGKASRWHGSWWRWGAGSMLVPPPSPPLPPPPTLSLLGNGRHWQQRGPQEGRWIRKGRQFSPPISAPQSPVVHCWSFRCVRDVDRKLASIPTRAISLSKALLAVVELALQVARRRQTAFLDNKRIRR
jgi:hypothetical protein